MDGDKPPIDDTTGMEVNASKVRDSALESGLDGVHPFDALHAIGGGRMWPIAFSAEPRRMAICWGPMISAMVSAGVGAETKRGEEPLVHGREQTSVKATVGMLMRLRLRGGAPDSHADIQSIREMWEAIEDRKMEDVLRLLERGVSSLVESYSLVEYAERGIRDDMPTDMMVKEQTTLAMLKQPVHARAIFHTAQAELHRNEACQRREEAGAAAEEYAIHSETLEALGGTRKPTHWRPLEDTRRAVNAAAAATAAAATAAAQQAALVGGELELQGRANRAAAEAKDAADAARKLAKTTDPVEEPPKLPDHLLTKQLPELAMKKTSENARAFIWTAPLSGAMRDDPENARTAITSLVQQQFKGLKDGQLDIQFDTTKGYVHVVTGHTKEQGCKAGFVKGFAKLCNTDVAHIYANSVGSGDPGVSGSSAFAVLKGRLCDSSLAKTIDERGVQFSGKRLMLPQKCSPGADFFERLTKQYLPNLLLEVSGFRENTQGKYVQDAKRQKSS